MANAIALQVVYNPGGGPALTAIGATDKLLWQKAGAFDAGITGAIAVAAYNGGFHIVNAANAELCAAGHPVNLQRGSANGKVLIDGAAEVDVSGVTTAQCLDIYVTCSPNAAVTAASVFAYDGSTEATAPAGLSVLAFKQAAAAFASIGGSAAALDLGSGASGASHHRYFGMSVTPTSNGSKTGTLKTSVSVV